ncbi:class-II fumarase/aspartase family protein [Methylobacterium aerolatum]|uniref:3-carboxy-cis,cis-muconate cycloisomerase n=1 Tax=Methylobacterium aerolatum TaxID=418708 RepID=A0ABU0I226_9HYPH|nr:adenylosuccinate lyase family protein [Methylobacterium aerolatum]MDQ0448652.1 3-carboxy-cis,cis-muconate cycloisomerase [Methylobacterium aerolatum]GJD37286.1 3-carboxy-cis,cis-muconate cycloisomerase [Methylobacterium aerolatum]
MSFSALDSGLLGPLFASEAMRAAFSDGARLAGMLRAEAALAKASAEAGLAPPGLAGAIEAVAPGDLDLGALGEGTALAGVPVIPFVSALRRRLPPDLEPAFHRGATTQDIADTALVLQMRTGFDLIARDCAAVVAGLARLARAHRATPCIGRTYGQHAAPISFGAKAATWALGIAEVADRLPEVRGRVLAASLGGPVGTLGAFGAEAGAVAEGFARHLGLAPEPVAWHTRRARIAEAGTWLALLLGALAKCAGDIAHLASTEVGEVAEPFVPGRGGSSAMPHKRNPVSATVILAAFGAAKGHAATLLDAMAAAHERPAGAWHAEWHALPQLFGLASGALREARTLAEGLEVDAGRMRRNLDLTHGLLFADAAAAACVGSLGGARAHALVERAAGEVRAGGRDLRTVLDALLATLPEGAGIDLAPSFDLDRPVAAAAAATDRALARLPPDAAFRDGARPPCP